MDVFDTLSAIGSELTVEQLDVAGGYFPINPYPWICWLFPETCYPYFF